MSGHGPWTLRKILSAGAARFREGADAVPASAWRRWLATLAAGYAVILALAYALVRAGRVLAADGFLAWEAVFLHRLEAALPLSFSTAIWIQTLGTDITLAIVVLFTAAIAIWTRRPVRALSIVAAFAALDLAVRIAWLLWDRARPDLILDGAAAPGFASYPSGHTTKGVAVYGMLAFLWARSTRRYAERALAAALAIAATLVIMTGRLRMGVHWPSDVAAGAMLGAVWLCVLAFALTRAERAAATTEETRPHDDGRPCGDARPDQPPTGR